VCRYDKILVNVVAYKNNQGKLYALFYNMAPEVNSVRQKCKDIHRNRVTRKNIFITDSVFIRNANSSHI
jgi:hypothetical protein